MFLSFHLYILQSISIIYTAWINLLLLLFIISTIILLPGIMRWPDGEEINLEFGDIVDSDRRIYTY